MSQNRAIYPSRYFHYIALLCVAKLCRSFGIFLSYDILKLVHVVQFLFCVKAGAAVFLVFLQKPFTNGKRISKNQWFRITRHAFFGTTIHLLWLFGLTLCGPLRTLLLFEHSDMVIIAGASALFTSASSPAKFRGAVFFLVAVMGILLFDHDDVQAHLNEKQHHRGSHNGIFAHLFDHMTDMTGLSDHKGGVVLLFGTLCMSVGFKSAARKLSVDVGGAKRLHALSTLISALLLLPWSTVLHFTQEMGLITSWTSFLVPLTLVILVVFVGDYYVEAACVSKLELTRTNCFGAIATFLSALLLSCFWNHPFVTQMTSMKHLKEIISEDHVLSGGVIFSLVLFIFATHILTSQTKSNRGNLIGFSAAGLPLYNFTGDKLSKTSNSLLLFAKNGLRQILEDSDSRKIFYFLCVNLSFTFVELIYGAWTNSLGLISDGFHMLFDCSALVMGLYAAVMSRWKATRIFSYGYDRIEVLSGFINGLFLAVIAFFVFTAALTRLVDPPEIHTERLLAVSAAGLVVNLFGIFAFRHAHSHGGGHGHSHGGGHGHSHGGGHGHSHNPGKGSSGAHSHVTHNTNMEGVFLHVLADTLGSVGVIISSILIENFGWKIADPVCSIFIAVLIFLSVVPLLKETAQILLLHFPQDAEEDITVALQKIVQIDGVTGYSRPHFWRHSSKSLCGTLHIQAQSSASEQKLIQQVTSLLKDAGITNLVVQVEKETYFTHMTGLGASVDSAFQTTQNLHTLTYQTNYSHL